ncbi:hypothetical protein BV898_18228 [Hypsibius exemplaris]|uniref:F-box domain-containing protein n=1 Tax=Hypsibius exemplaris TaxID=2072580 RepID=A0A9X6NJD5_HYPEX|nr:hypothetical protein BV898_18228 [Hypsibius exemplaris]
MPTLTLPDLPYEILVKISRKVPSCDIIKGLSGGNRRLNDIFRDEQYWKKRIQRTWPQLYEHGLRGLALLPTFTDSYWMKRAYRSDRLQRAFSDGLKRHDVWEVDRYTMSFGLSFCDQGKTLVMGDSQKGGLLYWNLQSDKPMKRHASSVIAIHSAWRDKIVSMRSQGSLISTGSIDSTLAIVDLKDPSRPPTDKWDAIF